MSAPDVPARRPTAAQGALMMLPGLLAFPVVAVVVLGSVLWWIGDAESRGVDTTGHGFALFVVFPLAGLTLLDLVLYLALLRRPGAGRIALAVVNGGVGALLLLSLVAQASSVDREGVILVGGGVLAALVLGASLLLMWRPPFAPRRDAAGVSGPAR